MPTATKDSADAMVWNEGGRTFWLCSRCVVAEAITLRDHRNGGYRAAIAHLWRSHGLRRVWITEEQPNTDDAAQLAFDVAIVHNRSF